MHLWGGGRKTTFMIHFRWSEVTTEAISSAFRTNLPFHFCLLSDLSIFLSLAPVSPSPSLPITVLSSHPSCWRFIFPLNRNKHQFNDYSRRCITIWHSSAQKKKKLLLMFIIWRCGAFRDCTKKASRWEGGFATFHCSRGLATSISQVKKNHLWHHDKTWQDSTWWATLSNAPRCVVHCHLLVWHANCSIFYSFRLLMFVRFWSCRCDHISSSENAKQNWG